MGEESPTSFFESGRVLLVLTDGAGPADLIGQWCNVAHGNDVASLADTIATAVHQVGGPTGTERTADRWATTFLSSLAQATQPGTSRTAT